MYPPSLTGTHREEESIVGFVEINRGKVSGSTLSTAVGLTLRVVAQQKLEVLDPVILSIPIAMMDSLRWQQWTSQPLRHYETMFRDVTHRI